MTNLIYLGLSFVKSLPWLVIRTNGSKLFLSLYLNIVCKKCQLCIGPENEIKRSQMWQLYLHYRGWIVVNVFFLNAHLRIFGIKVQ